MTQEDEVINVVPFGDANSLHGKAIVTRKTGDECYVHVLFLFYVNGVEHRVEVLGDRYFATGTAKLMVDAFRPVLQKMILDACSKVVERLEIP